MMVGSDSRHLAAEVVRTARWSGHLPAADRRTALRLWLANRLAGQSRESVRRAVAELAELFTPVQPSKPAPEPLVEATPTALAPPSFSMQPFIEFAQEYYGKEWQPSASAQDNGEAVCRALEEIKTKLRAALPSQSAAGMGVGALLSLLVFQAGATDSALRKAAQESFERLLESLSPAALEAQAGRRGVKVGPFYKASLYDAACEKFATIKTYHDSGRLVGDFRAAFKRYVRESEEQEGSE